jgi:hypothetical protein
MQVPFSLRFTVPFVICVAVFGLQGCGQAASPAGDVPSSQSKSATEGVVSTPSSTTTHVESQEIREAIPQKQEVSVDETPREPATVAEAARLLDLRTLPLLDGAKVPGLRTKVGTLNYDVKAALEDAFAFHHQQLSELGWQELPDSRLDGPNPRAVFTQTEFVVGMSAYEIGYDPKKKGFVSVSFRNYGNVLGRSLPVPDDVEILSADDTQVTYTTAASAKQTRKQCDRLLLDLGWEPYGFAGDSRYFKKNAILVSARVATFDNQPGKTFLVYNTELLSADIPMPTDYDDPRYDDMLKRVMFDCPTEEIEKVTTFYSAELAERGWKPTSEPVQMDRKTVVIYRNEPGDMIELEFQHSLKGCRVSVKQSTALEVAELERQVKEEAKQRVAALAAVETAPMPRVDVPTSADVQELIVGLMTNATDDMVRPTDMTGLADSVAGAIPADRIALPKKAADLQMEPDLGMVIYRSELVVGDLAKFYREEMGKLGWKEIEDETILFDDEDVGGISFAKGDGLLRIAVQSGQPESKTRIVIEGDGIKWPNGESDDGIEMFVESSPEERAEEGTALRVSDVRVGKCRGYLQLNHEKFEMNHAFGFSDDGVRHADDRSLHEREAVSHRGRARNQGGRLDDP